MASSKAALFALISLTTAYPRQLRGLRVDLRLDRHLGDQGLSSGVSDAGLEMPAWALNHGVPELWVSGNQPAKLCILLRGDPVLAEIRLLFNSYILRKAEHFQGTEVK